jgi:cysteine desulfurase family protein (TIGR01976 family)
LECGEDRRFGFLISQNHIQGGRRTAMAERPFAVERCREQFPGLGRQVAGRPAVFLDGPGGSQVPRRVLDAVEDCLTNKNANEGGFFATSRELGALVEQARAAVADLLGTDDPETVVFGPNMTTLTFALSRVLSRAWGPGDLVVLTRLDHDANVTPWSRAAREVGAHPLFLDVNPADCTLRLDRLDQFLNERTRLVAVGVASNAVGTVNAVRQIADAAHRVGALVFLDTVHAAPHLLTDVREWDCDFLACSAYKFFGPHVGILWGRRVLLERLPAYKVRPAPDSGPGRWQTGTPNFEGIAGTLAAVEYLADLGREQAGDPALGRRAALATAFGAIGRYERELADRLLAGLARLPGYRVWGITDPARQEQRVPTLALTHRERTAEELAAGLAEKGIFAWHGNFYAPGLIEALGLAPAGLLRLGLLHYNTAEEVDRVLEALGELAGERGTAVPR